LHQSQGFLVQHTGDAAAAHQIAVAGLDGLRQQQALSLAYFDIFCLAAVLALLLAPFVLFMKRSVAEKGSHVGGE
jgi:DHA2 family multidrug resistance protein